MEKSKTSIIWKTSALNLGQSRVKFWTHTDLVLQHIWGTFGLVAFKVILRSFGGLSIFVIWA